MLLFFLFLHCFSCCFLCLKTIALFACFIYYVGNPIKSQRKEPLTMRIKIGERSFEGITALLLAIPLIIIVGFILSVVLSILGFVLSAFVVIAVVAIICAIIYRLIPETTRHKVQKWFEEKLSQPSTKAKQADDGSPIIDVDYTEDK